MPLNIDQGNTLAGQGFFLGMEEVAGSSPLLARLAIKFLPYPGEVSGAGIAATDPGGFGSVVGKANRSHGTKWSPALKGGFHVTELKTGIAEHALACGLAG